MGDIKGFLKVKRQTVKYRPVCERLKDYCEVCLLPEKGISEEQSSRCMDCGTPFCHWACPVGNYIPEWNDLVFRGRWQEAFELLAATNNFPEITGRLCPALCEYSCVLGINDDPVTVRENELAIIEQAFTAGLLKPRPPKIRTGKKVAVVGSGPAGLACADQLNKAGHLVVVFEKADKIGGLLRYGIPDFKLNKQILERRIELLKKEGIVFNPGIYIGKDLKAEDLKKEFDAFCLAAGSSLPRDLKIAGRELKGIHFAMDYLTQANRRSAGEKIMAQDLIDVKAKKVVVIGGGDTGADCVGVALRQGAGCVMQIEILPRPPECRSNDYPWPIYPLLLKTSTSHEEGGIREWAVSTKKFSGENGFVRKLSCARVERGKEVPGSEFEIETDLVILALGFLHPEQKGLIKELGIELDSRGNVKTGNDFMTSLKGVFACGDMHSGQSLVVRAISEGRQAAHYLDAYLMGESFLPMI
ncbi:MAG: glutamate synthase subunit beta [Candidatus Omnitrophota bacterium]|jgi:glutamate synthase (NADPH/NADH) small chain